MQTMIHVRNTLRLVHDMAQNCELDVRTFNATTLSNFAYHMPQK